MKEETQMLNPRQVAEVLGVHQKTVHLWLRSGKLQGIKISYRAWRIPQSALDSFLATHSNIRARQQKGSIGNTPHVQEAVPAGKQSNLITDHQENTDTSPRSRMKHYIRDIMGEQAPEE
ncbi:helix-turn-helix domain-containing protein [Methanoregula sp.]|jgi:excisionase family DNA binding protein|uniref:helix-turn-helix domain-containing protein n=1 Tax=Methanoregula sp. TaxID=2052170 RepID=UPI00261FA9FC|nr:helix-turn-helix domain-containing protein [Methanoregula sp.]MDD5143554.1 helix-turn-helix domain-containing protein [Methanoregula sp.]